MLRENNIRRKECSCEIDQNWIQILALMLLIFETLAKNLYQAELQCFFCGNGK